MQSLEVISVNIWNILISLLNLLILFLILKKFLYKPVKKVLAQRQEALDSQYMAASEAEKSAVANKEEWEKKMQSAKAEADAVIQSATVNAGRRSDKIIAEARERADSIVRQAETEAELELKKAEDGIKREIVNVSTALTEKMLGREINEQDHHELINSFIEKIGDNNDV